MRAAIVSLGALACAMGAAAGDPVQSDVVREFQAGVDAYRLGKYDEARGHLEKAEARDPTLPGPHRFLAAVAQAQGRWADCVLEARRALQLNPRSRELVETRRLHDGCRSADGRPAYPGSLGDSAAIAITANVAGATVRIDGLRYGGTPLTPRRIKPGVLQIAVEKAGWHAAQATVDALPAIVTDVAVVLEPLPPAAGPRPVR